MMKNRRKSVPESAFALPVQDWVTQRDRLYATADEIATLLGIDPETVMVEPTDLRVSLTLSQAERLLNLAGRQNVTP